MNALKVIVQHLVESSEPHRKRLLAGGLAALAVVVLATGAYLSWYLTPPAMPETPEDAAVVMKSARFQRLSKEAKQPYYDRIREQWGMDRELRRAWREDDELRDASRDMMRQQMDERLDAFMLANAAQREAMMAEGMGWGRPGGGGGEGGPRGERPEGGPPGGGEGRGGEGGDGPPGGRDPSRARERISDRLANGSAQRGAAMGEMIQARRENGDAGGGGGGGRGGGGGGR